jgi:polyhydroxyalkanoate synthesis regulator phasin
MGAKKLMLMAMTMAGAVICSPALAQANDMLINTLAEKGIITYGEAQQIMTENREEERKKLAQGEADTLPAWIQNMTIKGDLRLRHQTDWEASALYARIRERLRLRLGVDTRIVENLKAGFGLATGSEKISDKTVSGTAVKGDSIIDAEPTSTNATFGNGFGKEMVMVDYAFLEYAPLGWAKVTAGKMKAGTELWNPTDLLWDTDINPDGIAVNVNRDINAAFNLFFTGSWLTFNEKKNSTSVTAPDVYIAQPGVLWKATDKISAQAAVAYQGFNVKGKDLTYYGSTEANSIPPYNYICWNPSFMVTCRELVGPLALSVFGDYVQNTDKAVVSDNTGSNYGLRFGNEKISEFGQWQLSYMLRRLERNAWL